MSFKYDVCLIDFFPSDWFETFKNINRLDIISIKDYSLDTALKYNTPLGHGIAVYNIISSINPFADICAIPIASNISVDEFNYILFKLIKYRIGRIINISFGFFCNKKKNSINKMNELCRIAKINGITIVCAESNNNKTSYPAKCEDIYLVTSNKWSTSDILINSNNAIVRRVNLKVNWYLNKMIWVNGNSFYAPIITGIFSKLGNKKEIESLYNQPLQFNMVLGDIESSNNMI